MGLQKESLQREVLQSRLDVYYLKTAPVSNYYKEKGILDVVEAKGDINRIYENIKNTLL